MQLQAINFHGDQVFLVEKDENLMCPQSPFVRIWE